MAATLHEVQAVLSGFPQRLTWASFTTVGKSPTPPRIAHTSSTFRVGAWRVVQANGAYRIRNFHVTVVFNPGASWATTAGRTDALLKHEQGHLDITGLCARDLARNLLDLEIDTQVVASAAGAGKTAAQHLRYAQQLLQRSVEDYGRQTNGLLAKLQSNGGIDGIYDKETNHGGNQLAQATWDSRLASAAQSNDNFALSLAMMGVV